jgi:hypothetical protein
MYIRDSVAKNDGLPDDEKEKDEVGEKEERKKKTA